MGEVANTRIGEPKDQEFTIFNCDYLLFYPFLGLYGNKKETKIRLSIVVTFSNTIKINLRREPYLLLNMGGWNRAGII